MRICVLGWEFVFMQDYFIKLLKVVRLNVPSLTAAV